MLLLAALTPTARADPRVPPYEGFLCCNLLDDGGWINDIGYRGERKTLYRLGTPVKVTGFGRNRVLVEIEGKSLAIGNDYSRAIKLEDFALRYVLDSDPRPKLDGYAPKLRQAIGAMRVQRGMTREQVLMALGYPPTDYTPNLDEPLWRYWADRSSEYQVFWGRNGRVDQVFGTPEVRARVVAE
ncbi:MAG: hypothetical protein HY021_02545 [Burkholderiales bacterium]|nr:hypothetical protein [Burkholderiales bacterium]